MGFKPFKKVKKFAKAIKGTVDSFTGKAAKDARKDAQRAADDAARADAKDKANAVAGENAVRVADRQRRRLGVLGLGGEAGALGTPAERASGRMGSSSVLGSAGAPMSSPAPVATAPAAGMLGKAGAAVVGKKKALGFVKSRRNV